MLPNQATKCDPAIKKDRVIVQDNTALKQATHAAIAVLFMLMTYLRILISDVHMSWGLMKCIHHLIRPLLEQLF